MPGFQQDQVTEFSAAGRAKLTELRLPGKDRSNGGEVAKWRVATLVQRMNDQAAWKLGTAPKQIGKCSSEKPFRTSKGSH